MESYWIVDPRSPLTGETKAKQNKRLLDQLQRWHEEIRKETPTKIWRYSKD